MAELNSDTLSQIVSQAVALPHDTNPYLWLSDFMLAEVVPHLSTPTLRIILWLSVASHSLALVCNLGVIFFRLKTGHFWIIRFTSAQTGRYLT